MFEGGEGQLLALHRTGTQHEVPRIEVVADDHRVVPGGRPGQAEILQYHHRIAFMRFAHHRFERAGDARCHRAPSTRAGEHFDLQRTLPAWQEDSVNQGLGARGKADGRQGGGQCRWPALVFFLREERCGGEFDPWRQVGRRRAEQTGCLHGAAGQCREQCEHASDCAGPAHRCGCRQREPLSALSA